MKGLMILICLMLVVSSGIHAQQNLILHQKAAGDFVQANSAEKAGGHYRAGLPLCIDGRSCTSFCLDDNGNTIFGSNYDNDKPQGMVFVNKRGISKSGFMPGATGQVARWTSRYAGITFTVVGYQQAFMALFLCGIT